MGSTAGLGIMGASSLASAYSESEAIKAQGDYQRSIAEANYDLASAAASDAMKRGEADVETQRKKVKLQVGAQRAALAAQGIDVDTGSAAQVQAATESVGALDAMTIRNNAAREAFGYKTQANNYRAQGDFAQITARGNANSTLLTGGMRAAGYGLSAYGEYNSSRSSSSGSKTVASKQRIKNY